VCALDLLCLCGGRSALGCGGGVPCWRRCAIRCCDTVVQRGRESLHANGGCVSGKKRLVGREASETPLRFSVTIVAVCGVCVLLMCGNGSGD
jgi:hypothetical protein